MVFKVIIRWLREDPITRDGKTHIYLYMEDGSAHCRSRLQINQKMVQSFIIYQHNEKKLRK